VGTTVLLIQVWRGSPRLRCRGAGWRSALLAMEYLEVRIGNSHGIHRGTGLLHQNRRRVRGHHMCDNSGHIRCRLGASLMDLRYCIGGRCMGAEGNDLAALESISKLAQENEFLCIWEKITYRNWVRRVMILRVMNLVEA
jgi:hypothetical protein